MVDINPLEGTPFAIVREDTKHFLVMGDHKLSPDLTNKEEVLKYFHQNHWLILTNIIIILIKRHEELTKLIEETQTNPYETTSL